MFPLKNGEKYIPNMDGLRFLNTDAFTILKALRLRMTQSLRSHLLREIETMSRVGRGHLMNLISPIQPFQIFGKNTSINGNSGSTN